MLGLRPRLKARNSLWDLVNKHHPDLHSSPPLSSKQPVEEGADRLPPSPFSPSLSNPASPKPKTHHSRSSESFEPLTMAPVSSTTPIASCDPADQANGSQRKIRRDRGRRPAKSNMVRLQWSQVLGTQELDIADRVFPQALSSPSQGMWPREHAKKIRAEIPRLVIVAENMIGCAMYELVCGCPMLKDKLNGSHVPTRSVSVTTA